MNKIDEKKQGDGEITVTATEFNYMAGSGIFSAHEDDQNGDQMDDIGSAAVIMAGAVTTIF